MSTTNDFSRLATVGWKPYFLPSLTLSELAEQLIGRITEVERSQYRVQTDYHEYSAQLLGRLHLQIEDSGDYPTVGDWVVLDNNTDGELKMIRRLLPRFSSLSRGGVQQGAGSQLLCANIDTALIVSSLNQEFNLRRLERYVTLVRAGGVTPVVVLTKTDLCATASDYIQQTRNRLQTTEVVALSNLAGDARTVLEPWCLAGDTLVLLGSSGVGKSTLINNLAGNSLQLTQSIRSADAKGRHTTTRRSLFQLPGDICVIDTPGMRELKLNASVTAVEDSFADVQTLIGNCRFNDCSHNNEPGCAINAALAECRLDPDRWHNYQSLLSEQQQQSIRLAATHEKRKREKTFARMVKQVQRSKKQLKEY